MEYLPPNQYVPIFDSLNYNFQNGSITYAQLAKYLPLIGGTITGNLYVNGILSIQPSQFVIGSTTVTSTATQLNYINVTPGTATATSALVLDSGRNVININNLGVNTVSIGSAVLNATDLGYISGTTPGTATASQALILDVSRNITNINNLTLTGLLTTPNVSITGTTDSTSISTGCLVLSGGLGLSKNLYLGGIINQTIAGGGNMITLTSSTTSARNTILFTTDNQNWEIGTRGSTASNPTNFYIYNGAYKLLMNPAGDTQILSSTDSTSITTGCLILSGGLACTKNITSNGWLTLNRNGSNININNPSSGGSALIELSASPSMLRLVRGFAINVCTSGITVESGSTRDARSVIDMGQTASNKQLSLYNDTSSYYGISANNSATQLQSGGGFVFYSGCTNASPINTQVLSISSGGRVELVNNGYLGNAVYNNMIYLSSQGVVLINSATVQSNTNWLECNGNAYFSSKIGVGITVPSYPIQVNASATTSLTSYGYLSNSGSGTSGSSGSIQVAIRCADRVIASEFDAYSDSRKKTDIREVTEEEANAFIKVKPINYKMIQSTEKSYGYLAQNILKSCDHKHINESHLLQDLISVVEEEGIEEMTDEDGFVSPANASFTINYSKCVPLLHKFIQMQDKIIKKNNSKIEFLETRLNETVKSANAAHNEIIDLQEQINNIIDHINEE